MRNPTPLRVTLIAAAPPATPGAAAAAPTAPASSVPHPVAALSAP
ncbi:hypothetical protein [Streptomyces sp. NPDC058335]